MREPTGRQWPMAAAGMLLGATVVMLVVAGTFSAARSAIYDGALWRSAVAGAATITALAAAGLLAMWRRSQLVGAALWWSLVMVAIGVHTAIDFAEVLAEPGSLAPGVEFFGSVVAGLAVFFSIKAVTSARIDLGVTPSRVVPVAIGVCAFVGLVSWVTTASWVLVVAWAAVAAIALGAGVLQRSTVAGWLGVGVLGVVNQLVVGFDASPDAAVAVSGGVILELGLILMLLGVLLQIERTQADLERRLLAAGAWAHQLKQARQAGLDQVEHSLHEARSALAAMEHMTRLLPRSEGGFPIRDAMFSEVAVLKRLVTRGPAALRRFRVADALAGTIAVERLYGVDVRVHVPAWLEAFGELSATAEAAQCLLENARVHAEDAPIEVAAFRHGGEVHISISDSGPGIAPNIAGRLFERGFSAGSGSGLGLGIARALLEGQGGRLWCDEDASPGSRFVMALPASSSAANGAHEIDDICGSADRGGAAASASVRDDGAFRRVIEGDRDSSI